MPNRSKSVDLRKTACLRGEWRWERFCARRLGEETPRHVAPIVHLIAEESPAPFEHQDMSKPVTRNRFLARQPILTRQRKLFAYEILSRYGPENYCLPPESGQIHVNAMDELFLMGLRTMTEGLPAFLNCTREFVLSDFLTLLPRDLVVGEILETVPPDQEVLNACQRMKDQGYRLALDDYCDLPEMRPLLPFADFVKIDVLLTNFTEQKRVVDMCHGRGLPVIAEKVETDEQFRRCQELGYDYFQGYFFCRPQLVGRKSVPANKTIYLQLLQA